ncbi:MAG: Inner membrane protein YbaL [Planctomycetes bacterium ADurb.Bin412]|nr:MAG: Inner membrane protein YbaL [Planctomycetes bacterium ADurb.Bin412]
MNCSLFVHSLLLTASPSAAEADSGHDVVMAIQIAIVAASILAVVLHRIKQPSLVAYIAAGLLLGFLTRPLMGEASKSLEHISSLGLILLLFVIGLELDLKKVLGLGKAPAAAIFLQGPFTIGFVWLLQIILRCLDIHLPGLASRPQGQIIFAAAAALSSTAVVVRLLGDKFDLTSQAGRITVLTLIAQDIWAVTVLSYISSQSGSHGGSGPLSIVLSIAGGVAVTLIMSWVARHLLARIMKFVATAPDLMAMSALAWCFLGSAAFGFTGLSAEMGALIAGLTIASLPQAGEVLSKVTNLRDFFMALFFVTLGMTLPPPSFTAILGACLLTALVFLTRFLLFAPTLMAARMGNIVSLTAALNLSQLSEFSLLLLPVGLAAGAITQEEASVISYALMLSLVLTPFAIRFNYAAARNLARLIRLKTAAPRPDSAAPAADDRHWSAEIYLLGYYLNAEALVRRIKEKRPDLLPRMMVIDYNLRNHDRIRSHGLRVMYGDICNVETLRHAGLEQAKVVVCTIANTFLRGTSNERLIDSVRSLAPHAKIITTSVQVEEIAEQTSRGAFASICGPDQTTQAYLDAIDKALPH